jgi:hypothetical protein
VRSRTQRGVVPALGRVTFLCFLLALCHTSLISSNRTPSRIICREELSLTRREELADKLRAITGWPEIEFDKTGALKLGSSVIAGGSQAARNLLNKAVSGPDLLIVEDASNRADVVFCQVLPGRWKNGAQGKPPAYVVLIDFADFDHLMGDKAALKAFDVGWGFLHEIDHVVNDSADADTLTDAGECEEHINIMRRECNLPLRTDYFFTFFPHANQGEFKTRFVRLAFEEADPASMKRRRYWLMWDAVLVGGLPAPEQIADRKSSL